ncbi:hypothetical protein HanXRQr2_Chr04g0169561 [Helianthus annuus]|uniref:Uncharacterized protein n=1 Tax=Helianthus annuus TaxID=4232 RepID=A0A251SU76_HELAN|nr:hypothetical protein HanXRQr2_Chr04g0169561 [Helianthus annuus]KAJ0931563.1 hypothetical protein HanPSC8_Chr04g0163151 [Helianthus annuus]
MEDLNIVTTTHELESATPNPCTAWSVVPNTQNPTMNMEMDMETETKNSNMEITISIKPDETMPPFPNPNPHSAQ